MSLGVNMTPPVAGRRPPMPDPMTNGLAMTSPSGTESEVHRQIKSYIELGLVNFFF